MNKPMSQSRKRLYDFVMKSKRELPMAEIRPKDVTVGMVESYLRELSTEGTILRRQVRLKPEGRAIWVFRAPDVEINPDYLDAEDPTVKPTRKPRPPPKEKELSSPDYKQIMVEEPEAHKILRDLPKGSQQVVSELYLSDYYDTSSPKFLKDHRPMKDCLTPDASSSIVQIIRDASQLQKITATSPPDWTAINSLAQSLLISAAGLMRDSMSNIWSEHDRK